MGTKSKGIPDKVFFGMALLCVAYISFLVIRADYGWDIGILGGAAVELFTIPVFCTLVFIFLRLLLLWLRGKKPGIWMILAGLLSASVLTLVLLPFFK